MSEAAESGRPLTVRILEKDYFVSCPSEERTELIDSAEFLSDRMREIRDSGRIIGVERIAVMAALNLAHEVLKLRADEQAQDVGTAQRLHTLRERVESALEKGQQLEL